MLNVIVYFVSNVLILVTANLFFSFVLISSYLDTITSTNGGLLVVSACICVCFTGNVVLVPFNFVHTVVKLVLSPTWFQLSSLRTTSRMA